MNLHQAAGIVVAAALEPPDDDRPHLPNLRKAALGARPYVGAPSLHLHRAALNVVAEHVAGAKYLDPTTAPGALADYFTARGRTAPANVDLFEWCADLMEITYTAGSLNLAIDVLAEAQERRALVEALRTAEDDSEPLDVVRRTVADALAAHVVREPLDVRPAPEWEHEPIPDPVLRRAKRSGAVVAVGEVAVLAGPSGAGKSSLALQIAIGAAGPSNPKTGEPLPTTWSSVADVLEARTGNVLILSWEDQGRRVADRLARLASDVERRRRVAVAPMAGRGRLWADGAPAEAWDAAWDAVADVAPVLVVIDTATSAFGDDPNALPDVRSFVEQGLTPRAREHACAVLLVHHANKAGSRTKTADGTQFTPDAVDLVGGSAAWMAAARGVLTLHRTKHGERHERAWRLDCPKANHGPDGWTERLEDTSPADPPGPPEFRRRLAANPKPSKARNADTTATGA